VCKTATFCGTPMAMDLVGRQLSYDFTFDKNAPTLIVGNPSIGDTATLKFVFVRLFLSWVLLFQNGELSRLSGALDLDQFTQKVAQQVSILVESYHQRVSDAVFGLRILIEDISQLYPGSGVVLTLLPFNVGEVARQRGLQRKRTASSHGHACGDERLL
jgi:hypothetical protein